jgi:hypothetical protein
MLPDDERLQSELRVASSDVMMDICDLLKDEDCRISH